MANKKINAKPAASAASSAVYDQENDSAYQAAAARRRRTARWYTLAMVVFAAIFLISSAMLISRFISDKQTENEFGDLESLINTSAEAQASTDGTEAVSSNAEKFAQLSAENPDFLGWISIDGTNLNFPVMYKPDTTDFYLRHDFYGEYSVYGVPYADEKTSFDPMSNNVIVYGHNMKTGIIFGCLTGYKKESYYQQHPNIEFDTIYGDGVYEVYAAFAIDVVTDSSFAYNTFTDMDEENFNAFVNEVKKRSDVDSGITPTYGDQLLTLSTCEYSTSNGRYVVCARKVSQ